LEEEIDDGLSAERRDLLDRALTHFLERLGGVEDEPDVVGTQVLEPGEVLAEGGAGGHFGSSRTSSTASRPSSLETQTCTPYAGTVVARLPMTSAWMGSSRPPRSTSTQSRMRRGRPKAAHPARAARTGGAGGET